METRQVKLIYRDDFITVLHDKEENIVLYGEHVKHFNQHNLDDWIKQGLLLELYLGSEKREELQSELLELLYEEELKVKYKEYRDEVLWCD